jgi:predicted ribosome quality control (RQC) complex YloA/Tae2 family protein
LARVEEAEHPQLLELEKKLPPPLRAKLRPVGPVPNLQKKPRRAPWRRWRGPGGVEIRSGRSARDNGALLRASCGRDLWLHVRGRSGAHVVVPDAGEAPSLDLLLAAAQVALAASSVAPGESHEVAWTRVKHVRQPKGAAPGRVLVSQEKVLWVRRDPSAHPPPLEL